MISAILCTYNRSRSLGNALKSLAASVMPESVEWEVVVVDNNSTDATREVTEDYCRRYPGRFRYCFEARQGKSNALNSGIRESRGDILAFVDDDVVVQDTWLRNLTSILNNGEWGGSGGRVLPEPGFDPPRWLATSGPLNQLGALCAYYDPGDVAGDLKAPPIGANMAFRRDMFETYGDFRTDLGPRPGSEIRHEDTEFGSRLMADGRRLRYVPDAVVFHEIHAQRVSKEFFLAWWFDFGRGSVRENEKNLSAYQIFRVVVRGGRSGLRWLISDGPEARFYWKCRIWQQAGILLEVGRHAKTHVNSKTAAVDSV